MQNALSDKIFSMPGSLAPGVFAVLSVLLLVAAWTDLRSRRIPNALVLSGSVFALLAHTLLPVGNGFLSDLPGGLGFLAALKGFVFGLLALLPLYWFRAMGAGDVKLLAMVGAFVGPAEIWWALLFTLLAGGVLAIAVALQRGVLGKVLQNLRFICWDAFFAISTGQSIGSGSNDSSGNAFNSAATLPYGVAIAVGCILSVIYRAGLLGLR